MKKKSARGKKSGKTRDLAVKAKAKDVKGGLSAAKMRY
jgi:hypothetical protein